MVFTRNKPPTERPAVLPNVLGFPRVIPRYYHRISIEFDRSLGMLHPIHQVLVQYMLCNDVIVYRANERHERRTVIVNRPFHFMIFLVTFS